ncbi:hypothetical protein [Acidovorax sp. K2F]|uniref:hypothetical protein n=1 Tax=Acidovorax sp. K2F TaxID=2978125 RepID=UPI0021B120FB|nr:hypothetical protein [Acidovorax sp. K2F]MCT6720640.1 hypothetical protein [Acidovorax sp. K2F]
MTSPFKNFIGVVLGTKPAPTLREAPGPAEVRLGKIPDVVDTAAWYEEHAQLCYDLQVAAVRAVRAASDQDAEAEVAKAHAALLAHAAIINGGSGPVLLAKDGVHPIPFERLAAARAKIKVLEAENARLRAAGGAGS